MWTKIINWALERLSRFLPVKRIKVDGELYLDRFYLCGPRPSGMTCKPRFPWMRARYLHKFHAPDGDRSLHNHPWDRSRSLILCGGYTEERCTPVWFSRMRGLPGEVSYKEYGMLDRVLIDQNTFHRIKTLKRTPTWTLFSPGNRVSEWGFLVDGEFKPYQPESK